MMVSARSRWREKIAESRCRARETETLTRSGRRRARARWHRIACERRRPPRRASGGVASPVGAARAGPPFRVYRRVARQGLAQARRNTADPRPREARARDGVGRETGGGQGGHAPYP